MRKFLWIPLLALWLLSCRDEERVFEKSADERAAEAIADLKAKLVAPASGWILRYRPEQESGSFNVLLNFDENDKVNIKTDFGADDGKYYDQTISYRIDNSLGLELVLETYSFFSYLFEQEQATFGAEYEFNYVNETEGNLVFRSKTDFSSPTTLVFQPASQDAGQKLGIQLAQNLDSLTSSLEKSTAVYKLSYTNKDLAFYLSLDDFRRTISFNYVAPKTGTAGGQELSVTTGYTIEGDALLFDDPLTGNFLGNEVSMTGIRLNELFGSSINVCPVPIAVSGYSGSLVESNEAVMLETSIFDPSAANFRDKVSDFISPLGFVFDNGESVRDQMAQDIKGVNSFQFYFRDDNPNNSFLTMGFLIENESGTVTFALKDFTPTITGNRIQFEFAPDYTLYNDTTATVNAEAMDFYINKLTEGGNTYIFKSTETVYELYNPCNGWSALFLAD